MDVADVSLMTLLQLIQIRTLLLITAVICGATAEPRTYIPNDILFSVK